MTSEMIAAMSTLVTALVSALAGAVVLVLNAKAGNRARENVARQTEYDKILARYENQTQKLEVHSEEQGKLVVRLRGRYATLRGQYIVLHDYASRQVEYMKHKGIDPGEPPPMPLELLEAAHPEPKEAHAEAHTPRAPHPEEDLEFQARQVEQASVLLRQTRPVPPAAGGVPPVVPTTVAGPEAHGREGVDAGKEGA
jgi:hypothetical protein